MSSGGARNARLEARRRPPLAWSCAGSLSVGVFAALTIPSAYAISDDPRMTAFAEARASVAALDASPRDDIFDAFEALVAPYEDPQNTVSLADNISRAVKGSELDFRALQFAINA